MTPADGVAKALAERLIAFAASQNAVAVPTNDRDLMRAASIGAIDAAVSQVSNRAVTMDAGLKPEQCP